MSTAKLIYDGEEYEFPVVVGTEDEVGIDCVKLRATTGAIALDPGYGNTGSCLSAITFIDGEKGILRYRGYPIQEVAEQASFEEVCYLLINGHLPDRQELDAFEGLLTQHSLIHESLKHFFEGFPPSAHPMMVLSAMVASLSAFYTGAEGDEDVDLNIIRLLAKAWVSRSSTRATT
jgi:citrate synthase